MTKTILATAKGAAINPFSTRYHAPGAVAFFFEEEKGAENAKHLLDTFAANGQRGEIVGPHGTGKTTLLRALEREARANGSACATVTLRDGERNLQASRPETGALLIVDGAEQLSFFAWCDLRLHCRLHGVGLLVTTHRPLGLPVLYRTSVDTLLARRIAQNVLKSCPRAPRLTEDRDVDAVLSEARGDMREALFKLYDLYERRWAASPVTSLPS